MKTEDFTSLAALAVTVLFIPWPAVAQQTGIVPGVPVQLVVSVEPKHGNEVPTLTQHDVIVHQGHNVRPVTAWVPATAENGSLALAILIDDGAGVNVDTQLNDIRTFIQQQAPATAIAVGYMENGTVRVAQNFTHDHAAAAKSLRLAFGYFGAEASPYVSLSDFVKRWPTDPAIPRREVLMITPGIDTLYMGTYPDPYVDAAVQDAQCSGVVVFSIYTPGAGHFGHSYWRSYWAQNFLSQLSEETGGESYGFLGPQGPVSFAPFLDKLNHQLANQFLLTFLAEPQRRAGREPVNISSEMHSVDFLHADRVCVPAAPE
jgi:hypothetical protein